MLQRIYQDTLERPKLVPFSKLSPQRIKVSCVLTLKNRHHCMILHGYGQAVELYKGNVNRENSNQKLKERRRCLQMEEPQSPTPSQKTLTCASGDRMRFIPKSRRHHHPTDWTQASQILPGWASGDHLFSSHHQCSGKTHRNCVKVTLVKDVGTRFTPAEEIRTSH